MTLFTVSARRRRRTPVMRAPIGPLTQQSNKVPKNAQTICRICINCWKMESSSNRAQLGDGMMDEDRIRHARPAPTAGASRKRAKLKTIPARPQAGGGREVFRSRVHTSGRIGRVRPERPARALGATERDSEQGAASGPYLVAARPKGRAWDGPGTRQGGFS